MTYYPLPKIGFVVLRHGQNANAMTLNSYLQYSVKPIVKLTYTNEQCLMTQEIFVFIRPC